MNDTALIDWLEQHPDALSDIEKRPYGGWYWYDWTSHPNHRGWTLTRGLRTGIMNLDRTRGWKPKDRCFSLWHGATG